MNCSYAQNFKRYKASLGASQLFAHSSWFIKICTLLVAPLAPSAKLFAREFIRRIVGHEIHYKICGDSILFVFANFIDRKFQT